jgi:hypothetical protein
MGPWTPAADVAPAFDQATRACGGARTFSAEVAVSGRAAGSRVRGRLIAGFERPGRVRLEGVAPFGAPAFVLAARDTRAVLLLPREQRVVDGESVADVLEALTGLRRGADDLLALLAGCVVGAPAPGAWSRNAAGWGSVSLGAGVTAFLRQDGGEWRLMAAAHAGGDAAGREWTVEYGEFVSGFPARIRLREQAGTAAGSEPGTDLTLRVSQREVNVPIVPAAFDVAIPPDARPMTLDELRSRGPLADGAPPRR